MNGPGAEQEEMLCSERRQSGDPQDNRMTQGVTQAGVGMT